MGFSSSSFPSSPTTLCPFLPSVTHPLGCRDLRRVGKSPSKQLVGVPSMSQPMDFTAKRVLSASPYAVHPSPLMEPQERCPWDEPPISALSWPCPCTPLVHGFTSPKAKLWVTECCPIPISQGVPPYLHLPSPLFQLYPLTHFSGRKISPIPSPSNAMTFSSTFQSCALWPVDWNCLFVLLSPPFSLSLGFF